MKRINENQVQYKSVMEFAVLGKDNELFNTKTLIATTKPEPATPPKHIEESES